MKQAKKYIILLNLLLVLFFFHHSIWKKEKVLEKGKLVLLRLAPVDPRSLMQGDYMVLNYDLGRGHYPENFPKRGYCIVLTDAGNVATVVRLQPKEKPLTEGELAVKYFTGGDNNIRIGAESYFFEEGSASIYDSARYGALRVDEQGNSVLYGLYDNQLKLIEAK